MLGEVFLQDQATTGFLAGINKLNDAVKVTLGPKGRNVVFDQKYDIPLATNDGVTIARQIELDDPVEAVGANVVKTAAMKANEVAGDGTTAAIVLAHAIVKEGMKNMEAGANPVFLKKGIQNACEVVVKEIARKSVPVANFGILKQVATISGNNDPYIGQIVSDAFKAVGMNGVVIVEDSQKMDTILKHTNGIKIENGYLSDSFLTDRERRVVEMENPYVLLVDHTIKQFRQLLKILEAVVKENASLLVIAQDVEGEALYTLAQNAHNGRIKVAAIKAPGFGDTRTRNLKALGIMLGAVVITDEAGLKLGDCGLEVCGRIERVLVEKETTILKNPPGQNSEEAMFMEKQIRKQLIETTEDYEIEKLQVTLSILGGGISLIKVGGMTEFEMFERKYRMEDSIQAVYAAVEEGIIPGGGKALLFAIPAVDQLIESLNGDEKTGAKILRKALEAPVRQIALNAGVDGSVVVNRLMEMDDNHGFDAMNLEYRNVMEAGIIDPAKVVRSSLVHAVSAAVMLLSSDAALVEVK